MRKRVALMSLVVALCLGLWAAEEANGTCWNCVATNCEDLGSGHVSCSAWSNPDGGRGCTAGGGTCRPVM